MVWHQHRCVMNCVDQQTLKLHDDYVLPLDVYVLVVYVLVCPLSATDRFLLAVCETVFHRMSLHLLLSS